MESATWHLNLLHVGLCGQRDDGLKLGAGDSSHRHRLDRFNALDWKDTTIINSDYIKLKGL